MMFRRYCTEVFQGFPDSNPCALNALSEASDTWICSTISFCRSKSQKSMGNTFSLVLFRVVLLREGRGVASCCLLFMGNFLLLFPLKSNRLPAGSTSKVAIPLLLPG